MGIINCKLRYHWPISHVTCIWAIDRASQNTRIEASRQGVMAPTSILFVW